MDLLDDTVIPRRDGDGGFVGLDFADWLELRHFLALGDEPGMTYFFSFLSDIFPPSVPFLSILNVDEDLGVAVYLQTDIHSLIYVDVPHTVDPEIAHTILRGNLEACLWEKYTGKRPH